MFLSKLILIAISLVHQTTAISHPHSTTSQPPKNAELQAPKTLQGNKAASASKATQYIKETSDQDDEGNNVKIKQKKVLGIYDELPEKENFKINEEVESLFLDQINAKIEEFEDLKTQIAVLDRHLRKHSDFDDFNNTDHMLIDLDEKVIKPYEDGLKVLKNKIIEADHEMNAHSVVMINTIVDKAENFLEISRERVYGTLDDHLASVEHKNEHVHGHGHSEDHLADYADLIAEETGEVEVSMEDEELLIEYIDMDIYDLENIIQKKADLEHHIKDHFNLDNVEPDELQLKIAENVLQDLNLEDMKSYENSLRALKSQIKESNGKLKVDMIDQISAAMEKAEMYLETSKDKLKLVGELDEEFEVFEMDESIQKLPTLSSSNDKDGLYLSDIPVETVSQVIINPVEKYSNEAIEDFKVAVGDFPQIVQEKSFSHNDNPEKHVVEVEEFPVEFLPFHFSVTLTILSLVVLVGLVAATAYRLFKTQTEKDESCEVGCATDKAGLISQKIRSPQLEMVNEDDGWNSKKWAKSWTAEPSRRKRRGDN